MAGLTEHHVQFFTAVCKDWLNLLGSDVVKQIVLNDLKYRISRGQVKVCAFVIMPNHLHLIWRIGKESKREEVQRDFLKYTARQILECLKTHHPELHTKLLVDSIDGIYQVWKRDSMSIDLFSEKFFQQKLSYIHANPCQPKWELATHPLQYEYSSAGFMNMARINLKS